MKKILIIIISLFVVNTFGFAKSSDRKAILAAKTEVIENLIAPATASFVSAKIIEKKNSWYIVYIVVDSQNAFGAYIRSGFLSCVKPTGNNTYDTTENGTQSTGQEKITNEFLSLYKATINWNSLE